MSSRTIPAASAVIADGCGRVLLVKRGAEPDRGKWSVPGGCVEPGETFAQAAEREALEETGLKVEAGVELWSVSVPANEGRTYVIRDFACTIVGGELVAGDDADDAGWFTESEMLSLPMVANLLEYLQGSGFLAPP